MWGGRGGIDLAPLDPDQSGVWKAQISQNEVLWERLPGKGDEPSPRSFHSSVIASVSPTLFLKIVIYSSGIVYRESCTSMPVVLLLVVSLLFTLLISSPLCGLAVQTLQILPVAELPSLLSNIQHLPPMKT